MKKKTVLLLAAMAAGMLTAGGVASASDGVQEFSDDPTGFVSLAEAVPDVILEIRYYSTYNFVGDRIDGYEDPCALITKEAAAALKMAAADAKAQGYMLKIYDAYRPQMAVNHFIAWAEDTDDTRMKEYFYPEVDKSLLFEQGYIAERSGHSRGSTVDLTLFDMDTGKELDMGGTFDYFGERSHPDYTGDLTMEQIINRNTLSEIMIENGFRPLDTEWWHFTLENEPYPNTYFTFPVDDELAAAPQTSAGVAGGGQVNNSVTGSGQADAGATDNGQTGAGVTDNGQTAAGATDNGQADAGWTDDGQADAGWTDDGQPEMAQCPVCGEWFSTERINGDPSEYMQHEIDEVEMSWIPDETENMVQCQFCGGWYEAGNVFRNHICPGRDEAYAPEE